MPTVRRAFALVLLLGACAGDPGPAPPELDPCSPLVLAPAADSTPGERASVAEAVDMWRARVGMAVTMQDLPDAPRVAVVFRDAPLAFLGIYERGGIVVNRGLVDEHARAVVIAHELGHTFGLVHVGDPGSVMHPGNLTVGPAAVDAAALAALWGSCDPAQ